ncbi:hypothetical protein SAMN04487904_107144 [Actinopolyspora lacussalsi subsp. righensis]|uniref:Alpha/beta hydrolase n=1 Tax=Actinopolyspora righensis TaxID=995060 RepID=A0A1I7AK47_9ACTN|nr:hypothetical protein SAMN04487904_107144 [Actinopolyspora righensis]
MSVAAFLPADATARQALVFSPVLPEWEGGAFFEPVTRLLNEAGMRVFVVDTLSMLDDSTATLAALAEHWSAWLPRLGHLDLVCGNALGGAVAQYLLPHLPPSTGVLLVSGPARTDATLERRLATIAEPAEAGHPHESLAALARAVLPRDVEPEDSAESRLLHHPSSAGNRLAVGMRMLRRLDVTRAVRRHPGALLNIVGGASRLVSTVHTAAAEHHRVHTVRGAGMRPHIDGEAEVAATVRGFLRKEIQR